MTGQSKIVRLEANKPLTAVVTGSTPAVSNFGKEEALLTLAGGRLLYLPADVAQPIVIGNAYTICKKQIKEGMRITWKVDPAQPEPAPAPLRTGDGRLRIEPAYEAPEDWGEPPPEEEPLTPLEKKLARSVEVIGTAKAAFFANAATPGPRTSSAPMQNAPAAATPLETPSRMTASLIAAIDSACAATLYAKDKWGITLLFSSEDVRCVANTIYIQNAKSSQ